MGKLLALTFIGLLTASDAMSEPLSRGEDLLFRSREVVKTFHQALGGKLKAAMKAGGPVQSIEVCSQEAQSIASGLSEQSGLDIKRVSNKVRNPLDAPDEVDQQALDVLESMLIKQNSPLETVMTGPDGRQRYYKAIVIQAQCLVCHGKNVDASVSAALNAHYPNDQAIGYEEGDLRGAFVVTHPKLKAGSP